MKDDNDLNGDFVALVAESIGAGVTFVFLMALGIKVYKIVKFTNKWLLSMMITLNLCVLTLIVFSFLAAHYSLNKMHHAEKFESD